MPKINKKSKNYKQLNQYKFRDADGNEIETIPNGENDPVEITDGIGLTLLGQNSNVNATGLLLHTHPDSNSYTDDHGTKVYTCHICVMEMLEGRGTGPRHFLTRQDYVRHIYAHVPTCKCKLTFKCWSEYDQHIPHCTRLTLVNRVSRETRPYDRIPYDETKRYNLPRCKYCKETLTYGFVIFKNISIEAQEKKARRQAQRNHARWSCKILERKRLFKKIA